MRSGALTDRAPDTAGAGRSSELPRVGFLGAGWIGRMRMRSLLESGLVAAAGVADVDERACEQAAAEAPAKLGREVPRVTTLEELLALELDGVVIATPNAQHASQAIAALEQGVAVFCQKPLACNAEDARAVIAAAQRADRLLGVDLSYRHTRAVQALRATFDELGEPYALDLVFHNAHGPGKQWCSDPQLAGGGCLIDLGTHLVDLALWLTQSESAAPAAAELRCAGRALREGEVEDFALVQLQLDRSVIARIACSWCAPIGRDARIECSVYGTNGGARMCNVGGSFYDFQAWLLRRASAELLVEPPDEWGGRALQEWAARLAADSSYDPSAAEHARVPALLDAVYSAAR